MIKVYLYTTSASELYAFKAYDHGDAIVCSAVSALALNTVNSIEFFTDDVFTCEYDNDGGFLFFESSSAKAGELKKDVKLLLDSFRLGIESIADNYESQIEIYINDKKNN